MRGEGGWGGGESGIRTRGGLLTLTRFPGVPLEPRTFTTLQVILPRDKFRSRLISTFADFVCEEITRISQEEEEAR